MRQGGGQIEEYLMKFNGEGIQHIALGTDDIYASVDTLHAHGLTLQDTPDTYFDLIFPTYTEIAAVAREFIAAESERASPVQAFLVDIPLCTTEGIPDFNRGYVENYVHYEHEDTHGLLSAEVLGTTGLAKP